MEKKHSFLKGALCGALVMFIVCVSVLAGSRLILGTSGAKNSSASAMDSDAKKKMEKIEALIEKYYLYEDEIDQQKLEDGIFEGFVSGLEDPYSVYYDEENTTSFNESTSGEYSGIGAVMSQDLNTGIITFASIYKGSPAEEVGIQSEDILYKVMGEEVTGRDLTEVVAEIRGPEGTKVDLTVLRGDNHKEITVTATRRKIEVQTVEYEMKEGKIGYISIMEFDSVTYDQYKEALDDLESQGMKGLVVDLRNNPGGNLNTVCEMLDLMLPKGIIVYTENKNGEKQVSTSDEEHQFTKPMAVLVNGDSASASEIYAGAIQDYELGDIVGTTTYGKGVVQQIFDLGDGTCLKLTVSEYFTPKGRSINGEGVQPDVEVEYEKNEEDPEADNQLDAALDNVRAKIK